MIVYFLAAAAVLSCTLFAGAAIYINFVEHPARLACGADAAFRQWVPSYRRATVMQATLAVSAAATGAASWFLGEGIAWLWGALVILAVVPFTLIVIRPINERLLAPGRDSTSSETLYLLGRWGQLHAVRSTLGLAASLVYLYALLQI